MTDRETALECLRQLNPSRAVSYESWLAVGMALHAAGCSVEDWERWCPDGSKGHQATCKTKWRSFGRHSSPVSLGSLVTWCREDGGKPPRMPGKADDAPDVPLTWETPIGPGMAELGGRGADYAEPVPEPATGQIDELKEYLGHLYEPDDKVSYVLGSFKDEDGKYKPMGRGVYSRTVAEIIADLERYRKAGDDEQAIENAIGSWDREAGGWIRINPMSGEGVTNNDVTSLRHVLVESDSMPVERQLATIHSMRLPCSAIVHSGGKSVHAIVRIDAGMDRVLYRERVEILFKKLAEAGFPVDRQCRNPSRLSRMPGLTRGGGRQYLVSGPCGASSWDDWETASRADDYKADILDPDRIAADLPDDCLLGNRFLTRGGSWLLVAQSGIGKSVFALQGAISFAVGRPLFGLLPHAPRRQLIVQAENNPLDVQEAYLGVVAGLGLDAAERKILRDNLRVVQADRYTGEEFCRFLSWLCQRTRPDIVWIDPLLAYIGGEISRMADCARFLRNALNPVIHDHGIGVVVVHHTGKPPRGDDKGYQGSDLAYLGIGSSDLTNWARATSTIVRCDDCANRYTLTHAKRADRAGCDASTDIMHAASGILWIPAPGAHPEPHAAGTSSRRSKYADMGFEAMPPLSNPFEDKENSPLLLWIQGNMEEHGEPVTIKRADNIRRILQMANIIVYDKDTKLWQGSMSGGTWGDDSK